MSIAVVNAELVVVRVVAMDRIKLNTACATPADGAGGNATNNVLIVKTDVIHGSDASYIEELRGKKSSASPYCHLFRGPHVYQIVVAELVLLASANSLDHHTSKASLFRAGIPEDTKIVYALQVGKFRRRTDGICSLQ